MKNKKMWKMSISLLMVLCLVWAAFGQCLPSGTAKAAEQTTPVEYTVELNNAGNVFLCNKIPTDGPVTITYKVESGSVTENYGQGGIVITTDPQAAYPYNDGLGAMQYDNDCYLLNGGYEHKIDITKNSENKAEGTYTVEGLWSQPTYPFSNSYGTGNADAKYFGIWLASGTGTAKLTNVTCVETATGKDLGLQTYSANCVVTGGETGETPVGPTEYTVELNGATSVFLCNKIPTDGPVTITYKVESGSVTEDYGQGGIVITTDPQAAYPYDDGLGAMQYDTDCYLLNEGYEHKIEITKNSENKAEGTYTVEGLWSQPTYPFSNSYGTGNADAKYFGIWLASGTGTAKLTNVTCVETETGKDLGLQTYSANCVVTGGETPVGPTAYTVELNNAGDVFLCNKIPTDGPVTITYTVESATHTYTRDGAIVTTDPTSAFPYNGTLGSMNYEDAFYLLYVGYEHSVTISKDENGKATGSMTVKGKWDTWSGGKYVGDGNVNAKYFGIWFANGEATAKLTNVTCVETETGKDLGLQTNSAACNIYAPHGTLKGATVSLGDDIGVNFYMDLSSNILVDENAYVEFIHPDKNNTVEKVMVKDAATGTYAGNDYSVFTCNIAAKEMASDIKLKVVNGSGIAGKEYTYQVKTYADKILNGEVSSTDQEMAMVKAMLNYGAYAQTHFNYHTESLANAGMDDADKALVEVTLDDAYKYTLTGSCTGLSYYGTSLMTTSKTAIRHYFELPDGENIGDFTFQYSGNTLEPIQKGSRYYVEIPGIVASKLGEMYDLTVTKESESMTLTYSPYTNVKGILEGGTSFSDESKNMMRSLYWYGCAAAELKNTGTN